MSGHASPGRIAAAGTAAAGAAALPTVLLGGLAILAYPIALLIAGGHVLVLGLPTYFVMRSRYRVDWMHALIAGFLIGALPLAAFQLLASATVGQLSFSLLLFLISGGCGLLGGVAFRAVVGPPADPSSAGDTASVFR